MAVKTPLYNLKAVTRETGLTPATLRAWERRYRLVRPQRSPGGHRLYSRQDIETLKWVVERQREGLSISQAAEMWKTNLAEAGLISSKHPEARVNYNSHENELEMLRQKWISACLAFDDEAANQSLNQAFAINAPEIICIEVLQKGLAQVGRDWYSGKINAQQEHFASAIAMRRLDALMGGVAVPTKAQTILVACPEGEEHDFILLMVAFLIRRRGWNVVYLGSDVPLEDLTSPVNFTHPALVLSAAQTLPTAASLGAMSHFLASQGIPLAYGGGIFTLVPAATRHISGYYLGSNLNMVAQIVELLVVAPPEMPVALPVDSDSLSTLASFIQNESAIRAEVTAGLHASAIEQAHLWNAIAYLASDLTSALKLGDVHLMDFAVAWVDGLLSSHGMPASLSRQFYVAYRKAIEKYLGEQGRPILEWFDHAGSWLS
jgi:DNA-binding transcriptional MerR regulator